VSTSAEGSVIAEGDDLQALSREALGERFRSEIKRVRDSGRRGASVFADEELRLVLNEFIRRQLATAEERHDWEELMAAFHYSFGPSSYMVVPGWEGPL